MWRYASVICHALPSVAEEKIEFVRHLENAVVSELPGTASFECELSLPNVKVQWLKAAKPILPDHKFNVTMDGAVHRLVIRDVAGTVDVTEYSATVRGLASKASLDIQGARNCPHCDVKLRRNNLETVSKLVCFVRKNVLNQCDYIYFFKLNYSSKMIILYVGIKYYVRHLLCDVINNA